MQTLLRVGSEDMEQDDNLEEHGIRLNELIPGLYGGKLSWDRGLIGFRSSIKSGTIWEEHKTTMLDVITKCEKVLKSAVASGLTVEFDCSVNHKNDFVGIAVRGLCCSPEFLSCLGNKGIELTITIYK